MSQNDFDVVIGLVGLKAAGKDELCKRLAPCGYETYRLSDAIREELRLRGVTDPTVVELQDFSNRMKRETGDSGLWAGKALDLAAGRGHRKLVVNGLRNPGEIDALRHRAGDRLILVGIVAPSDVRCARFLKRGQAGDPAELMAFLKVDDRDRGIGEPPEGQQVDRCMAMVGHENVFNNDGTLERYHEWIDALRLRLESPPGPRAWKGEFGDGA